MRQPLPVMILNALQTGPKTVKEICYVLCIDGHRVRAVAGAVEELWQEDAIHLGPGRKYEIANLSQEEE